MVKTNSQVLLNIGKGLSLAIGMPTLGSWKTAGRPKGAKTGTLGFNSQTNSLEYWNGTSWFASTMDKV